MRKSKNNIICVFSLILLLGLSILSKQENEMPEDKELSSGTSVVRGNMVKIDNYENVIKYEYHTLIKQKGSKNQYSLKDKNYTFLDEIELIDAEEYPQGLCITDDFVFISSYSGIWNDLGKIKVFDKNSGAYLLSLGIDERSHLGGVTFDGTYIWVCNSSKMSVERISYEFIKQMIHENRGELIDVRNLIDIYPVRNIPSTVTWFDGQLWVASHSVWSNAMMIGYQYSEEYDSLNMIGSFKVPPKVQGVAFTDRREVILSISYGRKNSSYIKKYDSIHTMSKDVTNYYEQIELPPCSEGIAYENGKLYVIFESAGKKYLEGTDGKGKSLSPLNKILIIRNEKE